jgi:signal transduction histidine kinase/ligand-binding sensor domain-containing protein
MSRYIRDQWGPEQGYPGGPAYAIAQTADGYLWIGAAQGLIRFDGFNFQLVQDTGPTTFAVRPVLGLLADARGELWIRLRNPSLLSFRDGTFRNVLQDLARSESGITAMARGSNGDLLIAALVNGIVRYHAGKFVTLARTAGLSNFLVLSLAETSDGTVWIGTRDAGLFSLSNGHISPVSPELRDKKINCLLPSGKELIIGTDSGVFRWNGTEITQAGLPRTLNNVQALAMFTDRESNLWIGTANGMVRVSARGDFSWDNGDRGPGGAVLALFEDREGDLWVGGANGIQRLRDSVFTTYSTGSGLPSETNGPVYVDGEDRTWFAPTGGGLYWLKDGKVGRVTAAGLSKDVVYSIAGTKNELWLGRRDGGLTHLVLQGDSFASETYTETQGLAQNSVYSVYRTRAGAVWAGTLSGGVSKLSDGKFTTYAIANGLASNAVSSILETSDGTMWFATPNGLSALANDRWLSYAERDGLPSENVNCLFEDSTGVLWIGTASGIAFLNAGRIQEPAEEPDSLQEQILGIAEDRYGWLWIATSNHVLRVNRDKLLRGALGDGDVRAYGRADGLQGIQGVKRHRSVVTDPYGHVWFSLNRGLSVVDPARLAATSAPAMVHIQAISADGNPIRLRGPIRVPASRHRITFSFAGLSLSVPGRVRFRYMLDGFDRGWSEPVATREAAYTNLNPGSYRFRVIASNPDGVWNSAEASLPFQIEPAFWQTWWFQLAVVLAFAFAIVAVYRLRLLQLTNQLNVRFEERLAERTRIAQELHDTLLQGFLSASMQLHVAVDGLPPDSPSKPRLNRVLQLMRQVVEEGRNAVRGLRSSQSESLDLEQAFSLIRQELGVEEEVGFRVIVDGQPRPLHPFLRDEVYRIGHEALVNAFRHSQAKRIEIEIEYGSSQLRVVVRDNGCGINPQVLQSGRDGHWGLPGMRERAERIGGQFHLWSSAAAGTEVELSVPGHVAFQNQPSKRLRGWFRKMDSERIETVSRESKNGTDE